MSISNFCYGTNYYHLVRLYNVDPMAKEMLTHLPVNILKLDSDDFNMVGRVGYKKLNVFRIAAYETLTTLRDNDKICFSLW